MPEVADLRRRMMSVKLSDVPKMAVRWHYIRLPSQLYIVTADFVFPSGEALDRKASAQMLRKLSGAIAQSFVNIITMQCLVFASGRLSSR